MSINKKPRQVAGFFVYRHLGLAVPTLALLEDIYQELQQSYRLAVVIAHASDGQ